MTVGEGGIRTPFIISGPGIIEGKTNSSYAYLTDIMPTILDLLNINHPNIYNGKEVLPMSGQSMLNVLTGKKESVYDPDMFIAGEMGNGKWGRKGDYKASCVLSPYGNGQWKLYNIRQDPGETTDISGTNKEMLKDFINAWKNTVKRLA